jgi:hypothetical protein
MNVVNYLGEAELPIIFLRTRRFPYHDQRQIYHFESAKRYVLRFIGEREPGYRSENMWFGQSKYFNEAFRFQSLNRHRHIYRVPVLPTTGLLLRYVSSAGSRRYSKFVISLKRLPLSLFALKEKRFSAGSCFSKKRFLP